LVVTPRKPHAAFWKKHTQHPEWHRIISRSEMTDHIRDQVAKVVDFAIEEKNAYYVNQFQRQQRLLDTLRPSKAARNIDDYGVTINREGYADIPVYDNTSSSTGRMSITSGPKILTMPREMRSAFVSRWGSDGTLLEVDYNALEVRVLAWIQGLNIDQGDAYAWIASHAKCESVPRSVVKEACLAAMYGMSKKNFALRFQDMPDVVDVYEKVRDTLGINSLERRLSTGLLTNAFGRKLTDTSAKISHHVQSTAVDVACDGFLSLVEAFPSSVPCFLIHDAIVMDVHRDHLDEVNAFCKDGLSVGIIDLKLPVRSRRFGSE
jgi:hypothetical protein